VVDSLSDFDRQRIEHLHVLLREDLDVLYEINRKQAVETRPLERRQLQQQAEQARQFYNDHREEYADFLRKEIPTRFAPGEQPLIHTVVQRLSADQLLLTYTALQEVDRAPDDPELAQLLTTFFHDLPLIQQHPALST
jgi:hypothetical protein